MAQTATDQQMAGLLEGLKSADNQTRTQAEAQLTQLRAGSARDLYNSFMVVIQAATPADPNTTALACLLLKKLFLDERKSEAELE